ncbi:hypothetical protein ACINK0_18970 (plasmid) [Deinococcus sp. VB343]|uniref:hypothetical protein n=1 Tax=Deinococcus sp. VB343 TaxID=3385567 RepID=UPI0039C98046
MYLTFFFLDGWHCVFGPMPADKADYLVQQWKEARAGNEAVFLKRAGDQFDMKAAYRISLSDTKPE